jgi:hypothetical protein
MAHSTVLSRLSRLARPADGEHNPRFTAQEVRELLGSESPTSDERLLAVQQVAAVPGNWTGHLEKRQAWQLGRPSSSDWRLEPRSRRWLGASAA